MVVNATPGSVSLDLLTGLALQLTGKVLIDAADVDAAGLASVPRYPGSSLAEEIQRALPDVRVVETLSTMHASLMADPADPATARSAFVSGNDAGAKTIVSGLVRALGPAPFGVAVAR